MAKDEPTSENHSPKIDHLIDRRDKTAHPDSGDRPLQLNTRVLKAEFRLDLDFQGFSLDLVKRWTYYPKCGLIEASEARWP